MATIYHNFSIKAAPNKVFAAVSKAEQLINWWPLICTAEEKLGGNYRFFFGEPYDWYGTVVTYEPDKSFHIKMTKSDADWAPTTFGFDLEQKENSTYLRFFHADWKVANDHFKHSSYCWALLLKALKNYVEKGIVIPFEQRS